MPYRTLLLFSIAIIIVSCGKSSKQVLSIPLYEKEIIVDGVINEEAWNEALLVGNLQSPWDENNIDKSEFKTFVTKNSFNFFFQITDNTPITVPFEKESSVASEDRVELFFSKDTTLAQYYCIEMDPNGNILDYSAKHYRDFDANWDFKTAKIATKITENGYIVEGQISLKELNELGILNPFYLGIFRADFKSYKPDDVIWFTWIKPSSTQPDFHIPSAFGRVLMKE